MQYVIAMEHDDSIVTTAHGTDDDAERQLGSVSKSRPGGMLLFKDGKLMAHAEDGVVFSYRPGSRTEAAA